jgi:hypothetical protein
MRENRAKPVLRGSIRAGGPPQSQHPVEVELIDRSSDAGLLDLPSDRAQTERIEGDGGRRAQESQVAEPRGELIIAHRQFAFDLLLGDQPCDRGFSSPVDDYSEFDLMRPVKTRPSATFSSSAS